MLSNHDYQKLLRVNKNGKDNEEAKIEKPIIRMSKVEKRFSTEGDIAAINPIRNIIRNSGFHKHQSKFEGIKVNSKYGSLRNAMDSLEFETPTTFVTSNLKQSKENLFKKRKKYNAYNLICSSYERVNDFNSDIMRNDKWGANLPAIEDALKKQKNNKLRRKYFEPEVNGI